MMKMFTRTISTLLKRPALSAAVAGWAAALVAGVVLASFGYDRIGTVEYLVIARNIAAGHGFVFNVGEPCAWRPPLYIYLVAGFYALFGPTIWPVFIFQGFVHGLTAMLTARFGQRLAGPAVGLAAGIAVAGHPFLLVQVFRIMTENLFVLVLVLMLFAVTELLSSPRRHWWITTGLLIGVAAVTRSVMMLFPVFVVPVAFWFRRRETSVPGLVAGAAALGMCTVLVIAPWTVRNYRVTGGDVIPISASGGYALWVGNHLPTAGMDDDGLLSDPRFGEAGLQRMLRDLEEALGPENRTGDDEKSLLVDAWGRKAGSDRLTRVAFRDMRRHPLGTLWLWVKKGFRFWFHYLGLEDKWVQAAVFLLQIAVLLPAVRGIYLTMRFAPGAQFAAIWLAVGYLELMYAITISNCRYSMPVLPHMLILAAIGILHPWKRAQAPDCGPDTHSPAA